jgi:hypothetical protein
MPLCVFLKDLKSTVVEGESSVTTLYGFAENAQPVMLCEDDAKLVKELLADEQFLGFAKAPLKVLPDSKEPQSELAQGGAVDFSSPSEEAAGSVVGSVELPF